jgi:hypothetical protein
MAKLEEPLELPPQTKRAVEQLFLQYATLDGAHRPTEPAERTERNAAALSEPSSDAALLGPAALVRLFADLGVDLLHLPALAFAWLGRWQHPCQCTRAEFELALRHVLWGCQRTHCDQASAQPFAWPEDASSLFQQLRASFPDLVLSFACLSSDTFLDFYLFAFEYNQKSPYARCLSLADARWLWGQLLDHAVAVQVPPEVSLTLLETSRPRKRSWRYLELFIQYLDTLAIDEVTITRDTWYWVLIFAQRTQQEGSHVLQEYDGSDAWPVLLDGFVRFLNEGQDTGTSLAKQGLATGTRPMPEDQDHGH